MKNDLESMPVDPSVDPLVGLSIKLLLSLRANGGQSGNVSIPWLKKKSNIMTLWWFKNSFSPLYSTLIGLIFVCGRMLRRVRYTKGLFLPLRNISTDLGGRDQP